MTKRILVAFALLAMAALVLALAACGDDSDGDATPSPTSAGPPDLSPRVGGVEAAQRYLEEAGVDGDTGRFTDPRSCAEIDDGSDGDFCIHEDFSTYAPGLVILRFADKDEPDENVWEMRLTFTDGRWQVNSVEPFGDDG